VVSGTPPGDNPREATPWAVANRIVLRRTALALTGVVTLLLVLCTVASGLPGLVGSAVGVVAVALFFGTDVILLLRSGSTPPLTLFAQVIAVYVGKLVLTLAAFIILRGRAWLDPASVIVSVVVGCVTVGAAVVVLWSQWRIISVDP